MSVFFEMDYDVNQYKNFEYDSRVDARLNRLRDGVQIGKNWKPISLEWCKDKRDRRKIGDFPSNRMGRHCPVFSQRAWDTLEPLIGSTTQPFPIDCPGDTSYLLVNVYEVIDCLDPKRSQFKYYTSGGVMSIERYVFRESLLKRKHMFRVPEYLAKVIVSEEFKRVVEEAELVGLDFRLLPGMRTPTKHKAKKRAASRKTAKKARRKGVRPERMSVEFMTSRGTLTLRRSLPPVSEAELNAVEKSLGVKFPKPYRDFLLTCNGGEPVPDGFCRPEDKEPSAYVQEFYEISDEEGCSLVEFFRSFKQGHNWLPKSLMPIANDPGGSLICLSVSGKDKGSVYFWDHEQAGERELEDPNDYDDVTPLAAGFDEFLLGFAKQPQKKR